LISLKSYPHAFGAGTNNEEPGSFSEQFSSAPESQRPFGCVLPFRACWIASDTSASFNNLALNAADVSITYHVMAEKIVMSQNVADRRENAWRDHFLLVGKPIYSCNLIKYRFFKLRGLLKLQSHPWSDGQDCHLTISQGPKSNPAKLPVGSKQTIYELFAQIFCAAIETSTSRKPVRFLTR
jgi:hypothetical protein